MINNKSIERKLKELRKSRDLKQSELAELVGLSRPAMSYMHILKNEFYA